MTKHVAVLMGGWSAEREVSLVSGAAAAEALREKNYKVTTIDVGRNIAEVLSRVRPDVVFNALHGRYGEDGTVQGMLELLGLPYTHSGVLASALAMDKPIARRLFKDAGLNIADGAVMTRQQIMSGRLPPKPYVIKPINEGSSVGVRVVLENDNFTPADDMNWSYGDTVLVERYIPGHEIHVAVMGERALGAVEIRPKGRFYDYEAKYTQGKADHLMPAPLPADSYAEALRVGLAAHRTLGCRGVSRTDLRYDDTKGEPGRFFVLEVNTQPGMTPLSLVPEIARHQGIAFPELVAWMVEDASCER
ncbi:MAG TPA: D-alanine--D-alanine ligase [Candidatus Cybelea sp.]|nr:D-alanine--D-alanine ligase [Candidatus Cybelea sp.]